MGEIKIEELTPLKQVELFNYLLLRIETQESKIKHLESVQGGFHDRKGAATYLNLSLTWIDKNLTPDGYAGDKPLFSLATLEKIRESRGVTVEDTTDRAMRILEKQSRKEKSQTRKSKSQRG